MSRHNRAPNLLLVPCATADEDLRFAFFRQLNVSRPSVRTSKLNDSRPCERTPVSSESTKLSWFWPWDKWAWPLLKSTTPVVCPLQWTNAVVRSWSEDAALS